MSRVGLSSATGHSELENSLQPWKFPANTFLLILIPLCQVLLHISCPLPQCCAAQALPNQADWSMESGWISRQEQLAKQAGKTMGEGGDVDGLGGQPHHHVSPNVLDHQDLNITLHHS